MNRWLISFLFGVSLICRADVRPIPSQEPPIPEPAEKFPWLIEVTSTHSEGKHAQRISGYGFVIQSGEKYFVVTASHLSQGKDVRLYRPVGAEGALAPVAYEASSALNLSDVEAFRIEPWVGIEPIAKLTQSSGKPKLYVNGRVEKEVKDAIDLQGAKYLPLGLLTYIPRPRPRGTDRRDFYLLGEDPMTWVGSGGVKGKFLENYFLNGYAPTRYEAMSHVPFAPGMSGMPVLKAWSMIGWFEVGGLVSGRSRHHRHGWFVGTDAIAAAVGKTAEVPKGERKRDPVEWKIHFGPSDYVLYRAGEIEGVAYRFEEIVQASQRVATGEGGRSDTGGGGRSDTGEGGRSDTGGGGRSDTGDGSAKTASYQSLGLDSGMGFAAGASEKLAPAVAFLVERGERKTLFVANLSSLRAIADLKQQGGPFTLRAFAPGEAILPFMVEHYRTHAKLTTQWKNRPLFPLVSHWIWRNDRLTGIGTVWMDLELAKGEASIELDYGEGMVNFKLTAAGTVKGSDQKGFRPFVEITNDKGEACQLNLGALLMVNPEMQSDIDKPQAKVTLACPEYQLYGQQHMGEL